MQVSGDLSLPVQDLIKRHFGRDMSVHGRGIPRSQGPCFASLVELRRIPNQVGSKSKTFSVFEGLLLLGSDRHIFWAFFYICDVCHIKDLCAFAKVFLVA